MNDAPNTPRSGSDTEGFALILVLMVMVVIGAIVMAGTLVGSNHLLISKYQERTSTLDHYADAGLEYARARLNGDRDLFPDSGYVAIESDAPVDDGVGGSVPGVTRSTYVGPAGITSGQYGIFAAIISVVRDEGGGVAVKRLHAQQESFAKFAYFTDYEPSNISFGGGDQIFGPVHTNSQLKIYSSGATFHDEARTAQDVYGEQYGTFRKGYEENVAVIPMPETADLEKLRVQAQAGGTHFTTSNNSPSGSARLRIEFMAIDLNGDGDTTDDDEGFLRAYTSNDPAWLSADVPGGGMRNSRNCGHYHPGGAFVSADDHGWGGGDNWVASLSNSGKRCYLGGADSIWGGFVADDPYGEWLPWDGPVDPRLSGRADAGYLFPISRQLNPDFKGVVFVDGQVLISGKLRGQVTVAATGDISFGDDLVYATDPGLGSCEDILGIFGGEYVIVSDNTLNAPVRPANGQNYFTYDDTKDEFFHGVVLALERFTVENYAGGHTRAEPCEGDNWGRGCLYLTGGIIQDTRGAVGTIWSNGGTGYVKRYSYDTCAKTTPPPYFPTTGHFARGQYYPVDPVGFDVGDYFQRFQMN